EEERRQKDDQHQRRADREGRHDARGGEPGPHQEQQERPGPAADGDQGESRSGCASRYRQAAVGSASSVPSTIASSSADLTPFIQGPAGRPVRAIKSSPVSGDRIAAIASASSRSTRASRSSIFFTSG